MIYVIFLLAAIGLLVADVNGLIHVSYWLIGAVAAVPFALFFFFVILLAICAALGADVKGALEKATRK